MAVGFYRLKVDKIVRETEDAVSIRLLVPPPLKSLFEYKAGQYLTFRADINGEDIRRSYSVCESPYLDAMPSVAVKKVPEGRMSTFMNEVLKEGDMIEAMPPMGKFQVVPSEARSTHYVLFGGGSGITPLMSILKTILHHEPQSKVTLVYGNRDINSIIFKSSLEELEVKFGERFQLIHSLDNAHEGWDGLTGRLTEPVIRKILMGMGPSASTAEYYICGPTPMMKLVEDTLGSLNIHKDHINLEYFTAINRESEEDDKAEDHSEEFTKCTATIEVYGEEHEIEIPKGETILDAAKDAGLDPPYSCTVGVCTTCRALLNEGKVSMDEREGLSDAEIEEGYILTCQSHPTTSKIDLVYE